MPEEHGCMIGLSGMDRGFAVSVLRNDAVAFAIEEDKLRRFRGLGMRDLEASGSRALDLALSTTVRDIHKVGTVVYVPAVESDDDKIGGDLAFVESFLGRFYGYVPTIATADHVAAHFAFERAVHQGTDHVLMLGRTKGAYSTSDGNREQSLELDVRVVSFVEQCVDFLGLGPARMHHLENMAQSGKPRFRERLDSLFDSGCDSSRLSESLREIAGVPRHQPNEAPGTVQFDMAASVHGLLQARVLDLFQSIPEDSRKGDVALCGGIFQSWSLNDALARAFPDNRLHVSFSPGNPSCAIGGPLSLTERQLKQPLGPFVGPEYSRDEIKMVLDNCKARYSFFSQDEVLDKVCDALMAGRMVGWFSGRCEFGYRALGARSIFANPASPYACDNLSTYLKKRPSYFAYAVATRQEWAEASNIESPYLTRSTHLKEYFGNSAVRLQTVSKQGVPTLYALLGRFSEKSGVPALLNTSLNYFDEPIACTPRDALKTYYASGLDLLVMENFVLSKS